MPKKTGTDINDVNPAECDAKEIVRLIYDYQRFAKRQICFTPEDLKKAVAEMIDTEFYNIYRG